MLFLQLKKIFPLTLAMMGLTISFQNCAGSMSASSPQASGANSVDNSQFGPPPLITGTALEIMGIKPCEASGVGVDYRVGPGQTYAEIGEVPWENIAPGDTVRIFHRPLPYKGKFLLFSKGTADKQIRVCGVRSATGERPTISGQDAVARKTIPYKRGDGVYEIWREQWGVVLIDAPAGSEYQYFPEYIQVDGLKITQAHPMYSFTTGIGTQVNYHEFGGCIWVERGHHVTLADNEVSDCTHAIFARSSDDGPFNQVHHLRLAGNYLYNNGIVDLDRVHTTYVQALDVIYEFNVYGPLRAGAIGNSLKDRSVGTVIRYNRMEDGARAMDLVEAEDIPQTAVADPYYRQTVVYGNQIFKDADKGSTIHYGGDHIGNEAIFRKGTLYFYHNSIHLTGTGGAVLFQISTTQEHVEAWDNVFSFDSGVPYPSMRGTQEVDTGYVSGGILDLNKNWINSNWADSDPYHPVPGQINGQGQLVLGTPPPFELLTFIPKVGSALIDGAEGPSASSTANAAAVQGRYPVQYQLDAGKVPVVRQQRGSRMDLGAVEGG